MRVTVTLHGGLDKQLGAKQLVLELPQGSILNDLLVLMTKMYGSKFSEALGISENNNSPLLILVNGRDQRFLVGMDTPLGDLTTVDLVPPIAGG